MTRKIIFWLDANFVHFGLAEALKRKTNDELYAIFDITDEPKNFYQEQKIVDFKKIWFYHNFINLKNKTPDIEYLKSFEEKYNTNLWLLAYNDRYLYTYNEYYNFSEDEILLILEQECKMFEKILDEISPDFIIMPSTTAQHNELFSIISRSKGIKMLMMGSTRFGNRQIISQVLDKIDYIDENESIETEKFSFEELQKFHDSYNMSNMVGNYIKNFQSSTFSYIRAAFHYLFKSETNQKTHFSYYGRNKFRVMFKLFAYTLRMKLRESFMNKNLAKFVDTSKPFIYFPLHQEQERTLLLGAPYSTNQLEMIKHIVKSLPIGYNLIIKDPPIQITRGWRSISELKKIIELPNVTLVHWSIPSKDIMKKCSLVISIKGSSAIECAFYGKPAIVFSNVGYLNLNSITKVKNLEFLPNAIRTALNTEVDLDELNKYVALMKKHSFEFNYSKIYLDFANQFHHNGFFADTPMNELEVKNFLKKHSQSFDYLAVEHIKKLEEHELKTKY